MKAVQVVLDDALLKRLDRIARQRKLSRSAVIREMLERALQSEQMDALVERERASYEKRRTTDEERETHELLKRAANAALSRLDPKPGAHRFR